MEIFSSPFVTVLTILGVIALVYVISVQVKNQREAREERNNPRSENINETNYNISREGMAEQRLPKDAVDTVHQVEMLDDTEQLPTNDEFYEGQEEIKGS